MLNVCTNNAYFLCPPQSMGTFASGAFVRLRSDQLPSNASQ